MWLSLGTYNIYIDVRHITNITPILLEVISLLYISLHLRLIGTMWSLCHTVGPFLSCPGPQTADIKLPTEGMKYGELPCGSGRQKV